MYFKSSRNKVKIFGQTSALTVIYRLRLFEIEEWETISLIPKNVFIPVTWRALLRWTFHVTLVKISIFYENVSLFIISTKTLIC